MSLGEAQEKIFICVRFASSAAITAALKVSCEEPIYTGVNDTCLRLKTCNSRAVDHRSTGSCTDPLRGARKAARGAGALGGVFIPIWANSAGGSTCAAERAERPPRRIGMPPGAATGYGFQSTVPEHWATGPPAFCDLLTTQMFTPRRACRWVSSRSRKIT